MQWIEDMNWKNIEGNSWDSFNYKSSGHLCEDGYNKFGDWYKQSQTIKKEQNYIIDFQKKRI